MFVLNTSAAGSLLLQEYFDFPPATAAFVLGAYIGPWIALWCLEGIFERLKWHLEATKMEADTHKQCDFIGDIATFGIEHIS